MSRSIPGRWLSGRTQGLRGSEAGGLQGMCGVPRLAWPRRRGQAAGSPEAVTSRPAQERQDGREAERALGRKGSGEEVARSQGHLVFPSSQ